MKVEYGAEMNNLTTIAALPQGGGCMSALPAEKNEAKKPAGNQLIPWSQVMDELYAVINKECGIGGLDWPSIVFLDEEPGC